MGWLGGGSIIQRVVQRIWKEKILVRSVSAVEISKRAELTDLPKQKRKVIVHLHLASE